jgi:hypothetical protein
MQEPEAVFVDDLLRFAAGSLRASRDFMDARNGKEAEIYRISAKAICQAIHELTGADETDLVDRLEEMVAA